MAAAGEDYKRALGSALGSYGAAIEGYYRALNAAAKDPQAYISGRPAITSEGRPVRPASTGQSGSRSYEGYTAIGQGPNGASPGQERPTPGATEEMAARVRASGNRGRQGSADDVGRGQVPTGDSKSSAGDAGQGGDADPGRWKSEYDQLKSRVDREKTMESDSELYRLRSGGTGGRTGNADYGSQYSGVAVARGDTRGGFTAAGGSGSGIYGREGKRDVRGVSIGGVGQRFGG